MDIQTIAELARQGGRLASDKQWVLADALKELTPTQITEVSLASGRNESTLLQYARAAERWSPSEGLDRVEGVSFSAHRVALSWGSGRDPQVLLERLKAKHGSPTVQQVRQEMGLEGHPAIELIERGIKKLDRRVPVDNLRTIADQIAAYIDELDTQVVEPAEEPDYEYEEKETTYQEQQLDKYASENHEPSEQAEEPATSGTWKPPITTSDVAGI